MKLNITKLLILLAEKEMSLQELSEKSGVSRNTVSVIKAGKTCRPDTIGKLARSLEVSVEELIED